MWNRRIHDFVIAPHSRQLRTSEQAYPLAKVYFHMFDGTRLFRDDVGMELPAGKALIDEAYAHIGEVRVSQSDHNQWSAWRMIVTDEAGQTLLHMTFDFELISQRGG